MAMWPSGRLSAANDWLNQAWINVEDAASSVLDDAMQAVGVIVGAIVLIALAPILAHAALALLLAVLGAPIWFILALFLTH